ncbi:MAG: class II glutamine amidotransferase [Oscillospiraceae bacterium]|nr:class II glutamine amidotransferase [Oscillospiraceae bacterium]
MCELMGVSASVEFDATDLLREFYSHSTDHPNGWGMATLQNGQLNIEKEPIRALDSFYLRQRLEGGVRSRMILAHIRYATMGGEAYLNSHPFSVRDNYGRIWTLIHNGTIFDYPNLRPFQYTQAGRTDSERILLYLIQRLNARQSALGKPLDETARAELLQEIFGDMSRGNKLNLILYDGDLMYVHTNYANSLYVWHSPRAAVFATVPLTEDSWEPVPFTALCVYRNERCCFQGRPHGQEYIDRPEDTKYLHTEFAAL